MSRNKNSIIFAEPNGDVHPYRITKVSEFNEGIYLLRPNIYGIDREKLDDVSNQTQHKKNPSDRARDFTPE